MSAFSSARCNRMAISVSISSRLRPIDAQKVRVALAALDFVGVVQPSMRLRKSATARPASRPSLDAFVSGSRCSECPVTKSFNQRHSLARSAGESFAMVCWISSRVINAA